MSFMNGLSYDDSKFDLKFSSLNEFNEYKEIVTKLINELNGYEKEKLLKMIWNIEKRVKENDEHSTALRNEEIVDIVINFSDNQEFWNSTVKYLKSDRQKL